MLNLIRLISKIKTYKIWKMRSSKGVKVSLIKNVTIKLLTFKYIETIVFHLESTLL